MGVVISKISAEKDDQFQNFTINFGSTTYRSLNEKKICKKISVLLEEGEKIKEMVRGYKGCETEIRTAISQASQENEKTAWQCVLPMVTLQKTVFEYANRLMKAYRMGLDYFLGYEDDLNADDMEVSFEEDAAATSRDEESLKDLSPLIRKVLINESLVLHMIKIIQFALEFDAIKAGVNQWQNDFSYYRRMLSKKRGELSDEEIVVDDELCGKISMYFAFGSPLIRALSQEASTIAQRDESKLKELLGALINYLFSMLKAGKFSDNKELEILILKTMVTFIVIYDNSISTGVFKNSGVNIKGAVNYLVSFTPTQTAIIDMLKFTSPNIDSAPKAIKNLLQI